MSLILLTTYFVFMVVYSQCKWQFGSNSLDLSCLQGRQIVADDDQEHRYTYTICQNGAGSCSGDPLMCKQVSINDAGLCYEIGRWNPALSPTYDEENGWQFEYQNGESCNPQGLIRTWAPSFVCDSTQELNCGDVTELFGSCRYQITCRTRFACPGTACDIDASTGLSGGWVFIIILIVGIAVYFIVGYIVMAVTVNKQGGFGDFANNIPNRALWCALPSLVIAGCAETRQKISGLMNKGKEGDTPLVET